jgi:hypothetical protein
VGRPAALVPIEGEPIRSMAGPRSWLLVAVRGQRHQALPQRHMAQSEEARARQQVQAGVSIEHDDLAVVAVHRGAAA